MYTLQSPEKDILSKDLSNGIGAEELQSDLDRKKFHGDDIFSEDLVTQTVEELHQSKQFAEKNSLSADSVTAITELCQIEVQYVYCPEKGRPSHDLMIHTVGKSCQCKLCSSTQERNPANHGQSDVKLFECEVCHKRLSSKSTLLVHTWTHLSKKPQQSEQCDKQFTKCSKTPLIDGGKKLQQCAKCLKEFRQSNLLRHIRTHGSDRPYQCATCPKQFSEKANLVRHSLVHGALKLHRCEFCAKEFFEKRQLLRHLRTHSGEKPHECMVCARRFADRSNLMKHLLTHTGERPHQCEVCLRKFSLKSCLTRHLRSHCRKETNQCEICGRQFSRKGNFAKHLLTHSHKNSHPAV